MTIPCTWAQFKKLAIEFETAAPTLNLDELEGAWHCLGLAYLGMSEDMWRASSAILLQMETRVYLKRAAALDPLTTYRFAALTP